VLSEVDAWVTQLRYHDAIWHGSVALAAGCHFAVVVMWLES
jgi:predicted membrane channel-forming protein YqfA (hemolysin III family)